MHLIRTDKSRYLNIETTPFNSTELMAIAHLVLEYGVFDLHLQRQLAVLGRPNSKTHQLYVAAVGWLELKETN